MISRTFRAGRYWTIAVLLVLGAMVVGVAGLLVQPGTASSSPTDSGTSQASAGSGWTAYETQTGDAPVVQSKDAGAPPNGSRAAARQIDAALAGHPSTTVTASVRSDAATGAVAQGPGGSGGGGPADQASPASQPTSSPSGSTAPPTATPTHTPRPTATPTPAPTAPSTSGCGPANPWGFNYCDGQSFNQAPQGFCSYFACVAGFSLSGYEGIVQCTSGPHKGLLSRHEACAGGERWLFRPEGD